MPKIREDPISSKESPFPVDFGSQPCLVQMPGSKKGPLIFINPFDGITETRKIPELLGKRCLGYFGEWFLLLDVSSKEMFFLNLNLDSKINLPRMLEPPETLGGCVLTSSVTSPKCEVIFVLKGQSIILHCRPKDQNWRKISCNLRKDYYWFDGEIVICEGNLYALCSAYSSVNYVREYFISVDLLVNGIAVWTKIVPPSGENMPRNTREEVRHLMVSRVDVFLVKVIFNARTVVEVAIFSFKNLSGKPGWRRERGIDHCVSFLCGRNVSFATNHETLQHYCIYILRSFNGTELLYKINMDNQTFNFNLIPGDPIAIENNSCWVVPSRTRRMKREIGTSSRAERSVQNIAMDDSKGKENTTDISRQWADMPIELVELLFQKLSVVECIYVSTICKAWSSIPNIIPNIQETNVGPWLMYCSKDSSSFRFVDPLYGKEYHMDLQFLGSDRIVLHFSKDGWVLISCGKENVFVINPFTGNTIKLPPPLRNHGRHLAFASVPTSPDFVVFAISFYEMITWRLGDEKWTSSTGSSNSYGFKFTSNNPVFYHGKVYYLGRDGNLGVFVPKTTKLSRYGKRHAQGEVLDCPGPILEYGSKEDCYLMELEGELISVFLRNEDIDGEPIRVFKLDQIEMKWVELDDLGDFTLFIDCRNSIAKRSPMKNCAKRIYFPRFNDNNKYGGFYSMETKKYCPELYGLTEPMNCVWIEPNFNY